MAKQSSRSNIDKKSIAQKRKTKKQKQPAVETCPGHGNTECPNFTNSAGGTCSRLSGKKCEVKHYVLADPPYEKTSSSLVGIIVTPFGVLIVLAEAC